MTTLLSNTFFLVQTLHSALACIIAYITWIPHFGRSTSSAQHGASVGSTSDPPPKIRTRYDDDEEEEEEGRGAPTSVSDEAVAAESLDLIHTMTTDTV